MELTGTAGRALGRRIGAVREKERAAVNDNFEPPARNERGHKVPAEKTDAKGGHATLAKSP